MLLGAIYVRDRQHPSVKVTGSGAATLPLVPVVDVPRFSNVPLPKAAPALDLSVGSAAPLAPTLKDKVRKSYQGNCQQWQVFFVSRLAI